MEIQSTIMTCYVQKLWQDSVKDRLIPCGATDEYRAKSERSIELIYWEIIFYFRSLLSNEHRLLFLCAQNGQSVRLTTHLHLVSRFRPSDAIYARPLHAFIACPV
jgi:hypothetical protein